MNEFDIVVIGAGPGGSIAAKIAADNGYSTCFIEKEKLDNGGRYKACGGAMAWELIEQIDYPEDKIGRVIESLELHHVDGEDFSKKGKGAIVWRDVFDKFLTDLATDSGATLKENELMINIEKVEDFYKISTNKDKYTAKYIIAAESYIDKILGSDTVHLFFGIKDLIPVGYAWLFPKTNKITVGWGNQIDLVKNSRKEFEKFWALPYVKEALKNSTMEIFKPHLIPVGVRPKLYEENVFAVGDAGGMVDPISGKGIPYAMMSGQIAIETIKSCEKKDRLDKLGTTYENSLDRKFLKILKAKRIARDKIFKWEKHRASEIVMKKLLD